MNEKKPYHHLNAFLVKDEHKKENFDFFIRSKSETVSYEIDEKHNINGIIFVKKTSAKKPKWSIFVEGIVGSNVDELSNRSSSAVMLIKSKQEIFAFTFGYGRFMLNLTYFVQDFGIKTALNTLNHDSLRSVDLITLSDQAVQKKSQAARNSEISEFGIDISKDILRAVTGTPKDGIKFRNVSGGDAVYSFSLEMNINEITGIAQLLYQLYKNDDYKSSFPWVDNIRRIKDSKLIESLDNQLVNDVKNKSDKIVITLPEIQQWDMIYGFSFTRSKDNIQPVIETSNYLNNIDIEAITINSIKRDNLFVYDIHENEFNYSIYKCIYYEVKNEKQSYILFSGLWYEINNSFIDRINQTLDQIETTNLKFPPVLTWAEEDKKKIETEGDWNKRAAKMYSYYLLDKKLIKSNRATTSIELCDLLTDNKQFIHVKHRKGGSAGLSHLFAQGSVSAEIMLGDRDFRKAARKVLNKVKPGLSKLIPINKLKSDDFEIIYIILGEESSTLKANLPFFSKVNLSNSFENLSQRGYLVKIGGVSKIEK